jgi:CheY-like chemotaxis protein
MKTVLLVDDDPEIRLVLRQGLKRCADAFEVRMAGDGIEALEYLRSQEISLVVTDLKMPRMDGFELLAAIMESYPGIPVIVISGFSTPDMQRLARQGGAVAFIAKPFPIESLTRHILTLLQQQTEGGILHGLSPSTFLQLIEMEQKTCTIRLEDKLSGKKGILFFVQGELFDARLGDAQGLTAALEILAWDSVSLWIQNDCAIREKRIRRDLYFLILEAARRKDEKKPLASDPVAELRLRIRARIENEAGGDCRLEDADRLPGWDERVKRISRHGERLNLGQLIMAYVGGGESRDYIVLPGEPATVLSVNPKYPRGKIMQLLGR